MYEPDTILVLKKPKTKGTPPQGDPESEDYVPASEDYKPFPYDRVRVLGQSPISHSGEGWSGEANQGVIIAPLTEFDRTLDEPYGKLLALYNVESIPVHEAPADPVRVINPTSGSAGPTPEEQFAQSAEENPQPPARRHRPKQEVSPLEDPRPAAADASPLSIED